MTAKSHSSKKPAYIFKLPLNEKTGGMLLIILGIIIISSLILVGEKNVFKLVAQYKEYNNFSKRCIELTEKNKQLELEIEDLKNNAKKVEKIARRELGLVLPNEIVYRFVSPVEKVSQQKQ